MRRNVQRTGGDLLALLELPSGPGRSRSLILLLFGGCLRLRWRRTLARPERPRRGGGPPPSFWSCFSGRGQQKFFILLPMPVDDAPLQFFNPYAEISRSLNRLPHWQQTGATYFLTFRLADAVPDSLRLPWEQHRTSWMLHHPKPWTEVVEQEYHQRFSRQVERWLDTGHGSCALRRPDIRSLVAECLKHFDGERYLHHAWVIMPNHVHTLTSLHDDWSLEKILHTWKSYTSHHMPRAVTEDGVFWQEDYYDRLIRDASHFANCMRYIRRNPSKAKLREDSFTLFESDLARAYAPVGA